MMMKLFGAAAIVFVCGGFGFSAALKHRDEITSLEMLLKILDNMECELNCRLTPLPQLCRNSANRKEHNVAFVFRKFAQELDSQVAPDAYSCMYSAVCQCNPLSDTVKEYLLELGETLGVFDLPGQLKGINGIRVKCIKKLEELETNKDTRLRSYQTLGICAGAALAILLI